MNEDFWTTGVIKLGERAIVWPNITAEDVLALDPEPDERDKLGRWYKFSCIYIQETPFTIQVHMPKSNEILCETSMVLEMHRDEARRRFKDKYPIEQVTEFYEALFLKFLGSAKHVQKLSWGRIELCFDHWIGDPRILACYRNQRGLIYKVFRTLFPIDPT